MDSLSSAIVSTSSALAQQSTQSAVNLAVLKTALNVQAATAAALVQALPPPVAAGGGVGSLLDVYV